MRSIDLTLENKPSDITCINLLRGIIREEQFVPAYAMVASAYMRQDNINKALDYIVWGAEMDHPGCQHTLAQVLFHSRDFFDISDELHDMLGAQAKDWLFKAAGMRICKNAQGDDCLYSNEKAVSELVRYHESEGSESLDLNRSVSNIPMGSLRQLQEHVRDFS